MTFLIVLVGWIFSLCLHEFSHSLVAYYGGDTTVREMMSAQCQDAADTTVPKYNANAHIRDTLNKILRDEFNDYWVVDENGLYLGIARQRDVLKVARRGLQRLSLALA